MIMTEEYQNNEYKAPDVYSDASIDDVEEHKTFKYYFVQPGKYIENFSDIDIMEAKLEEPINELDPIVFHDPPFAQPFIVKLKNKYSSADNIFNQSPDADDKRIEGVVVPVVRLNAVVLSRENIVALSITSVNFLPELTLIVRDPGGSDAFNAKPGLNNIIQVVITPSIDGKYKKITLPFYITNVDVDVTSSQATYTGVLKHMPLINEPNEPQTIVYPKCLCAVSKERCIPIDESYPNMWQLFHEVAKRAKLGFAAMKGLKDYEDHTVRNICSQSYKDFLEYNLRIGGLNENMIYDGWVDFYGYLVLVDVYKALHDPVEPENLAMYAQTGLHTHNEDFRDKTYEKLKAVRRILTNCNMTKGYSNIEIEEFYNTSDIGEIIDHGTLQTMFFFNPFGNGGINNFNAEQIRIQEDSKDGKYVEDYEVSKYCGWSFVGCEEMNMAKQMEIRDAYLTKIRNTASSLTIRLKQPNFALQRGTLVTIVRMKYDYRSKMKIMFSETNLYEGSDAKGYKPDDPSGKINGIDDNDILMNDGTGITSPEESGIYYIDGMRFDYIAGNNSIQQYLYLIRRGPIVSIDNRASIARLKFRNE